MKRRILHIVFTIGFCVNIAAQADKNPEKPIISLSFDSTSQWIELPGRAQGVTILENQNHNLEVSVWSEISDIPGNDFLRKKLQDEGVDPVGDLFKMKVDHLPALAVFGQKNERRFPYRMLYILLENNGGYSVIRFECPLDCSGEHFGQLEELIDGIQVRSGPESQLYIASQMNTA